MGLALIKEVLDHAPAGLTPAQRLVLVILAEEARDATRLCWPGTEKLMNRSGLSKASVKRVLGDLVERGAIERVSHGTDSVGAPIYAYRGHATEYRITPTKALTSEPLSDEIGAHQQAPSEGKGAHQQAPIHPERGSLVSERGSLVSPLPSVPSTTTTRERAARATKPEPLPFPDGWTPHDGHRRTAQNKGLDIGHEAEMFEAHARANGRTAVDWDSAFVGWLGNSSRRAGPNPWVRRGDTPFAPPGANAHDTNIANFLNAGTGPPPLWAIEAST